MSLLRLMGSAALAAWIAVLAAAIPAHAADVPRRGVAASLAVDALDVEQVAGLAAGVPLVFTVYGSTHAAVVLRIDGARRLLDLRETEAGVYEGTYVIDARDDIRADSRVTATLQRDGEIVRATLDEPLVLAAAPPPWSVATSTQAPVPARPETRWAASPAEAFAPVPSRPVPRSACSDCAVVESIRTISGPPGSGVVGAIVGAIAGGAVGNEVSSGPGRHLARLAGALGGTLLGREIERHVARNTHYDVVLRRPDGSTQSRRYEQAPPFAVGDTVRLGGDAPGAPATPPF